MAQIQLKDVTPVLKDGTAGTALVDNVAGASAGATVLDIDTVSTNAAISTKLAVNDRFNVAGSSLNHVITSVQETVADVTDQITFTPALAVSVSDDDTLTIISKRVEVILADGGNLSWSENRNLQTQLNRGRLSTVIEGDEVAVSVDMEFRYDFLRTGTNESPTFYEIMKGTGAAATWVSSGSDPCAPYAVDLCFEHEVPCAIGGIEDELVSFPEFRWLTMSPDIGDGSIAVTGESFRVEPVITRLSNINTIR